MGCKWTISAQCGRRRLREQSDSPLGVVLQLGNFFGELLQRTCQLNEKKIVKPQVRREAAEHQITMVAQGDPNDGIFEQLLKKLEELDKLHELSVIIYTIQPGETICNEPDIG